MLTQFNHTYFNAASPANIVCNILVRGISVITGLALASLGFSSLAPNNRPLNFTIVTSGFFFVCYGALSPFFIDISSMRHKRNKYEDLLGPIEGERN